MTATVEREPAVAEPPQAKGRRLTRGAGLLLSVLALGFVFLLSVSVGARSIPLERVWELVFNPDGSDASVIVHDLRIPRTILGVLVAAALGVAGALMQALTRNPLADPGVLGVNAGASAAVVTAVAIFNTTDPHVFVWFAFLGAAAVSVLVYGLGATGRAGATPVRLALAGTAVTYALIAYVQGLTILDRETFDAYRFWAVGSIAGHEASLAAQMAPFIVLGIVIAVVLARPLNALALGDDAGRALGASPGRIRIAGGVAIMLLCGAATAAVGPITFIGLTVPHMARAIVGPDQRWVIPYSIVFAPILLLSADVIGRVIDRPGEIQVGIVTAFVGAPVFIALVRKARIKQL